MFMEYELKDLTQELYNKVKGKDFITCECSICKTPIRRAKGRFKADPFENPPLCHSCINREATRKKYGEYIRNASFNDVIDISSYNEEEYSSFFDKVHMQQKYTYLCKTCGKEVHTSKNMYHDRKNAPPRICPSCKRKETAIKEYGEYAPSKVGKEKRIANGWKPKYSNPIDISTYNADTFFDIPSTQILRCKCTLCDEYFLKEQRLFGDSNPFLVKELLCPKCIKKRASIDSFYQLKDREKEEKFTIISSLKEFINLGPAPYVPVRCTTCNTDFTFHYYCGYKPNCPTCNPSNRSIAETEVYDFVKSHYEGEVIRNDRKVLKGKEIDIYIPELNLAIEYDGLFWHTDIQGKDRNYHKNKQKELKEKGISCIFIREHEWEDKRKICENIILTKLRVKAQRVYARECEVKEVEKKECSTFIEENHLQGDNDAGTIKIGLYHSDALVACITLGKPRFNRTYQYELIRFVTKSGVQVVGGFSKMLQYFIRVHNPESIITYSDKRFFSGEVYKQSGFTFIGESEPSYIYLKNHQVYSRQFFQKKKLAEKLEIFNPDLSEFDNMTINGYNRIYDCGNSIFVWKK